MKLVSHKVNMYEGYANDAKYEIWVEDMPELSDLRYEQRGHLYFAEKDGLVSFYAYSGPGDGYGGRAFPITLVDGTEVVLKGPWSSRPAVMMKAGFPECVDVVINGIYASNVTREWLTAQGLETVGVDAGGETIFVPSKDGVPLKETRKSWFAGKSGSDLSAEQSL